MKALVVGGAATVHDDMQGALKLFTPDLIIAVNRIGMSLPVVDHWVSYHCDQLKHWLARRRTLGLDDPKMLWSNVKQSHYRMPVPVTIPARRQWGGSSGLFAVQIAVEELFVTKVILAGVPMTKTPHFDSGMKVWNAKVEDYHAMWIQHKGLFADKTRSMSGWTQAFLGAPAKERLDG